VEIAAIQIPLHNRFYMGVKEAASPLKMIFIDLLHGFKVLFQAIVAS
jgi:hypothetical protein